MTFSARAKETESSPAKPVIFLFHHFPGDCVHFNGNQYSAHDGIPRVMRLMVRALLESGKYSVKVTGRRNQVQNFYGFFKSSPTDDLEVICLEDLALQNVGALGLLKKISKYFNQFKAESIPTLPVAPAKAENKETLVTPNSSLNRMINTLVAHKHHFALTLLIFIGVFFRPLLQIFRSTFRAMFQPSSDRIRFTSWYLALFEKNLNAVETRLGPLFLIQTINRFYPRSISLIPHYHLFPECLELSTKSVMYIPDFTPHFFLKTGEFGSHLQESAIGQALVQKTSAVITNSLYSKSYLPHTRLQVPENKIHMFYLPNLNTPEQNSSEALEEIFKIKSVLDKSTYLFYPTQPRQNKKLNFLLRVFDEICSDKPHLKLVLTSHLVPDSAFELEFQKMKFKENVIIFPHVSDDALSWLYKNSAALTLTSVMEGNFPPQVFEALIHRTPVVATRLPLITERLGAESDALILCEPESRTEFKTGILRSLASRQEIIQRQEPIRQLLLESGSISTFNHEVLKLFENL